MFKYLIRLFTVFSLLFPVVTHAADFSTDFSPEFQTCIDSGKLMYCDPDKVVTVGCERPEKCPTSANCTATYDGCRVTCNWSECFGGIGGDIIIPIKPAEICIKPQVPVGCEKGVSYNATCNNASNPCQSGNGDGVCTCEIVKYENCTASCQFSCGQGYYITSNTGGTIGPTCAKCTAGCKCDDGVNEDCSGQPQCGGYWLNGECMACPDHATCKDGYFLTCKIGYKYTENNGVKRCDCPSDKYENPETKKCEDCPGPLINNVCIPCQSGMVVNGVCVDCPKNGICENGDFECNGIYIKYYDYETDRWACVACGDRCIDDTTCPLYGECSAYDTSNTDPEFEQCVDGFTMDLNLDAGTVKCQCTGNAYINSSGQCVACLDNAVCSDEKLTGCKEGFQKLTDEKSGNIIMCTGCTPNGTCSEGVFQSCNANYYGNESGCYKCPDFDRLPGKSTPGSNKVIGDCSVTASKDGALGEDERGYFYFETETGTCNATNATTK